ncbi:MAG TPA: phage tail sheath C-terminal domain-containing protein, partial [Luteitalea sp.]|nr:phage tail sheath C-terminal domain-containing protein [Luteitalea sp.]
VVFEPNDERLWEAVRVLATTLMSSLLRDGALQGRTPREAFFVRCDRSTTSQDDIDNGRLVLEVGMAAVRPAEFIVLRIGARTRRPEGHGDLHV